MLCTYSERWVSLCGEVTSTYLILLLHISSHQWQRTIKSFKIISKGFCVVSFVKKNVVNSSLAHVALNIPAYMSHISLVILIFFSINTLNKVTKCMCQDIYRHWRSTVLLQIPSKPNLTYDVLLATAATWWRRPQRKSFDRQLRISIQET